MSDNILDCSTLDVSRETVARLMGVDVTELRRRLAGVGEIPKLEEPTSYVVQAVTGAGRDDLPTPEHVVWFHASRVVDPDSFTRDGILTKAVARARLEPLLRELAVGIQWAGKYMNRGSATAKTWINDEGPCAFLFRSVAVNAPGSTHAYTLTPELVEDLAGEMLGANGEALVERFRARTVPCVVKFHAPGAAYPLANALRYLHLVETGHPVADAEEIANTCYVGSGRAVPASDVISIEVLAGGPATS